MEDGNSETFEENCVSTVRRWMETEADFEGRTDTEFILMFLRGCKFNLQNTKKKLTLYHENRNRLPNWLGDRDITHPNIASLLQLRITTALIDGHPGHPTILFTILNRGQSSPIPFDDYVKVHGIILESAMRRRNCQDNGLVWVCDIQNYPSWLAFHFWSPFTIKNLINAFVFATPLLFKGIHLLNATRVASTFWPFVRLFLGPKFRERVHFHGSDFSSLFELLPTKLIPEEYGGEAGPMTTHEDEFLKEVLSQREYFLQHQ